MKIIVDVNILLSALIKDSTTRKLMINSPFELCFPEPSLHKIRKYQDYIIEKSGVTQLEYATVLRTLLKFIKIIPTEEIIIYWDEAKKIMKHIDPEDVTFIATALSQEDSMIWSEDKHFEKQQRIRVLKTEDMIDIIPL